MAMVDYPIGAMPPCKRPWTSGALQASCPAMLTRLRVRDFRCFESVGLDLHPRLNAFTGRNAQGKTSLLEAICVLMRLQSPRTSSKGDWIRFGATSCALEGQAAEVALRYTQTATARRLAVEGGACSKTDEYLRHAALIVWMDHADMNLTRGSAEHRRKFLDFAAAQIFPEYRESLKAYERVLRSRNYLLKKDDRISWRQVEAYNEVLARHAATLRAARQALIQFLLPHVERLHHELSGGSERAGLRYMPGYQEEDLAVELTARRADEERTRVTVAGPHRDDLELHLNDRPAGVFGSEGQQRSLSVALKVAQALVLHEQMGQPPLILLDDVFGELDKSRRRAVLRALPAQSQIFVTTTSLDWAEQESWDGAHWEVEEGRVRALRGEP